MVRDLLRLRDFKIGRKHVATLMRKLGIEALYRKANTSRRYPGHQIYPYLLRGLRIERPNQVWAMDLTYIPMARGFVYLTAVLDWASRRVLAWRLSNNLGADACVDALEAAIHNYGAPELMNTDQGSQFTGADFIGALQANQIQISRDGRGCWRDNVFVERLWKSIKYAEVYLHAYDSVAQAKASLTRYIVFYNGQRPHRSLDGQTRYRLLWFATGKAGGLTRRSHLRNPISCPTARGHLSFQYDQGINGSGRLMRMTDPVARPNGAMMRKAGSRRSVKPPALSR